MAKKMMKPQKLENFNELGENLVWQTADSAAEGFSLDFSGKSARILILAQAGAGAATLTVRKGDGLQGVADYVSPQLAANETRALVLESGPFLHLSGEHKGRVLLQPSVATLRLAAIELP